MFDPRPVLVIPLIAASTCPTPPPTVPIHFTAEALDGSCAELAARGGPTRDGQGLGEDGAVYTSVQDALDRAPDGADLLFEGGSYCVNLSYEGARLTLAPEPDTGPVVLDGTGCDPLADVNRCSTLSIATPEGAAPADVTVGALTLNGGRGTDRRRDDGTTRAYGGALYGDAIRLSIDGATITGGDVTGDGGGVFTASSDVEVRGATFTGNHAAGSGAGLEVTGGTLSLTDSLFTLNQAVQAGGGLYTNGVEVTAEGLTFDTNHAGTGGGLCLRDSQGQLSGLRAEGNTAGQGGGLCLSMTEITLKDASLLDNAAIGFGGGLYVIGGDVTVRGVRARGNTAQDGGAVAAQGATLAIAQADVRENRATGYGGGIYAARSPAFTTPSATTITASAFLNNTAKQGGHVGVSSEASITSLTLDHVTLTGGWAASGGAVYAWNTSLSVTSSILAFNSAVAAPNISARVNPSLVIRDDLLWDRVSEGAGFDGLEPGRGCIIGQPAFYDDRYHGGIEGDDVHLRPGTLGIDAATPGSTCLGGGRLVPCLDPDGSPADLGAFGGPDSPERDADGDGLPDGWEAAHGLDPADGGDAARDQDGDGATAAQELAAGSLPFEADSDDDGILDGAEIAAGTDPRDFADPGPHPGERRTLYIPDDAPDLASAAALAGEGATLKLRPGIHAGGVTLGDRDLRITSTAGREGTELRGDGVIPTLTLLYPPRGLSIDGLTITGGGGAGVSVSAGAGALTDLGFSGNQGSGLKLVATAATVTDSVFEGNAGEWGGGISLVNSYGVGGTPTLLDLVVSGNTASARGGGIYLENAEGSILEGITVQGNEAPDGGGLYVYASDIDLSGFVVTGNEAERGGGAFVDLSQATNLSASGNQATSGGGAWVRSWGEEGITGGRLSGNHATQTGGGLYATCDWAYEPVATNVWIDGNSSDDLGGGVYLDECSALALDGVALVGNVARAGGGLYAWAGERVSMSRIVAVSNRATGGVGGGFYFNASDATLTGSIVTGNAGGVDKDAIYAKTNAVTFDQGVLNGGITGLTLGALAVRADPLLLGVPQAGKTAGADLHLKLGSPAVGRFTSGGRDPDGSLADAGIYGGPLAAGWDVDMDGAPAWFWTGSYASPPAGVDAAGFDADDLSPSP